RVLFRSKNLDTLFFVSGVVFSHGAPQVESYLLRSWFRVIIIVNLATSIHLARKTIQWFHDKVGDLRALINDSWGSDVNRAPADTALDFLFELENPPNGEEPINVV